LPATVYLVTRDDLGSASERNQGRIVSQLRLHGVLSRAELAERTGLSRGTIATVLGDLLGRGLVHEAEERDATRRSGTVGRRPSVIMLDLRAGVAAGVDIGKRHLRVGISDLAHTMLAERDLEVPPDLPAERALDLAEGMLDAALREAGVARADVVGLGVALPGPLHAKTGKLGSSTILPGWAGVSAAGLIRRRFGVDVRLDNDANLGALAERIWGAGRDCTDFAYIKLATGIGCGLVLGGDLYRGVGGTAGELGHVVIDANGAVCRCGNRGCLETAAGSEGLLALLRPTLGPLSVTDVVNRSLAGDPTCRRVVGDTGHMVGTAIATLVNLFNPGKIIIGGALALAGGALFDPLRATLSRASVSSAVADLEVVPAALDQRAELAGAIALILRDTTLAISRIAREGAA
jgi:predicted NBD/HSP70 family sugar kinase